MPEPRPPLKSSRLSSRFVESGDLRRCAVCCLFARPFPFSLLRLDFPNAQLHPLSISNLLIHFLSTLSFNSPPPLPSTVSSSARMLRPFALSLRPSAPLFPFFLFQWPQGPLRRRIFVARILFSLLSDEGILDPFSFFFPREVARTNVLVCEPFLASELFRPFALTREPSFLFLTPEIFSRVNSRFPDFLPSFRAGEMKSAQDLLLFKGTDNPSFDLPSYLFFQYPPSEADLCFYSTLFIFPIAAQVHPAVLTFIFHESRQKISCGLPPRSS